MRNAMVVACGLCAAVASVATAQTDPWAAPASYYAGATGEGATLRSQLRSAMSAGHIQRTYGDFRYASRYFDTDPNNSSRILLVYNRASVSANWDSGATWNREHLWPQSLQPGSASNSSRGPLADPHMLRPANPSINSSRGNKPFGTVFSSGSYGSAGSYYFPGDADKGDVARSLFYHSVRWDLALVNGFPSSNQMGDLTAMAVWHFADVPDEFERRRNHAVYSSQLNPTYYTNNRNAFVDKPGMFWSVFMDNQNDSQLYVGDAPAANGSSSIVYDILAIDGTPVPTSYEIALHRNGSDGVYYAVTAAGDAVTDQPLTNGFTNAFGINEGASRTINVGFDNGSITGPGSYNGTVTIDNLDVTTGFGSGRGGQDANDTIVLSLEVLAPAVASLESGTVTTTRTIDLGDFTQGSTATASVPFYAFETTAGFTSGVSLSVIDEIGDADQLLTSIPFNVIPAGSSSDATVVIDTSVPASYSATFVIDYADDGAAVGAQTRGQLELTITADIVAAGCDNPADIASPFGELNFADVQAFLAAFGMNDPAADLAAPQGSFDFADVQAFLGAFGNGCP